MSYRDPDSIAVVAPPVPKSRKSRSLRFYAVIFVGLFLGALVIGFGTFALILVAEVRRPFDKAATLKAMEGLPVYPGALLEETLSKVQRVPLAAAKNENGATSGTVIVYRVSSQPDFVVKWFDAEMEKIGYTIDATSDLMDAPTAPHTHRYTLPAIGNRPPEIVIVQSQRAPDDIDTTLTIMRLYTVK